MSIVPASGPDDPVSHPWLDTGCNGKEKGKDWGRGVWDGRRIVKRPKRCARVTINEEPPPDPAGFVVLPRRWVLERIFSWIDQNRRISKDY